MGALFELTQIVGVVTGDTPPVCSREKNRQTIVTSTGKSFQIFKLDTLALLFTSPFFDEEIRHIQCLEHRTYVQTKRRLFVFSRAEKTCEVHTDSDIVQSILTESSLLVATKNGKLLTLDNGILSPVEGIPHMKPLSLFHVWSSVLVSAEDGKGYLYNPETKEIEKELALRENPTAVAETPDRNIVLVGMETGEIDVVDIATDTVLFTFSQKHAVTAMCFSKTENSVLYTADTHGTVYGWDMEKQTPFFVKTDAHAGPIHGMFVFGKNRMVTCGKDNVLQTWSTANRALLLKLKHGGHTHLPRQILFYNTEKTSILSTDGETLRESFVFKNTQSSELSQKESSLETIKCFAASSARHHQHSTVVTVHGNTGTCRLWSADKKRIDTVSFSTPENRQCLAVAVSTCGNYAAVGDVGGSVSVFLMQSGRMSTSKKMSESPIAGVCFCSAGKILCGDTGGNVFVLALKTNEVLRKNIGAEIKKVVQSVEGSISSVVTQNKIHIVDPETVAVIRTLHTEEEILDCVFSRDRKLLFSSTKKKKILVWDILAGVCADEIKTEQNAVSLAVSHCGSFLGAALANTPGVYLFGYKTVYTAPHLKEAFLDSAAHQTTTEICLSRNRTKWKALDAAFKTADTEENEPQENSFLVTAMREPAAETRRPLTFAGLKKTAAANIKRHLAEMNEEECSAFLALLSAQLETRKDFDLSVVYLRLLLAEKNEMLLEKRETFAPRLEKIKKTVEAEWEELARNARTAKCVLDVLQ
ncbi:MAG: U3 snoRNA-associated protein 21, UTP21 [Amphiamblys sp. WSBS2006]|nr:MAG: U3 snoRNA-associated protein 21, UTP21 [Amphiamblys sp. WSBS2006]